MLRDGEVPEGRTEATVVQKVAHRIGHRALEPLQGAPNHVDSVHRHRQRTIRITNQNGGESSPIETPRIFLLSRTARIKDFVYLSLLLRAKQVTTSSEDRETLCLDDIKFSPGDHNHNGRDRDLDRHLDSLSTSSSSSACSGLSWDSSPSVSCRAFILKKEPSEDLEEDEEHEVRSNPIYIRRSASFCLGCDSFYASPRPYLVPFYFSSTSSNHLDRTDIPA